MKTSLASVNRGSLDWRFSARDLASISRYCRELWELDSLADITTIVNIACLNARAMMDVGSSVRTTIEESLKICSESSVSSR